MSQHTVFHMKQVAAALSFHRSSCTGVLRPLADGDGFVVCSAWSLLPDWLLSKHLSSMAARYLLLVAFASLGAAQARTLPSSAEHALTVTTAADLLAPSPRATTITPDPKYEPLMCAPDPCGCLR